MRHRRVIDRSYMWYRVISCDVDVTSLLMFVATLCRWMICIGAWSSLEVSGSSANDERHGMALNAFAATWRGWDQGASGAESVGLWWLWWLWDFSREPFLIFLNFGSIWFSNLEQFVPNKHFREQIAPIQRPSTNTFLGISRQLHSGFTWFLQISADFRRSWCLHKACNASKAAWFGMRGDSGVFGVKLHGWS